jgi:hypothetical protein
LSPPPVPANVAPFIKQAAAGTKLPESVVAAQNYTESAYGANEGPSTAGAEGPWQFLPSTFQELMGTLNGITSWATSTNAYIKYMNQLLAEEHGNVRDALAAYNAGPDNKSAGYGYADSILSMAGQSSSITVGADAASTPTTTDVGSGIFSWPGQITGFFNDANSFVTKLMWLTQPGSWLRIGSFALAILFIVGAVIVFTKADQKISLSSMPIPVPV